MGSEIVPAQPGDIVNYQTKSGTPEIERVFHGENMWLTWTCRVEFTGFNADE
ncbi:hypothetical protein [Eggerthella lenta]|uniref:hypothetical protein n=1 Tax=Eggerthella lenta TaxID=84112 RepID=UPI00130515E0|nr:hypothetical protein [Eggerthella lenta]